MSNLRIISNNIINVMSASSTTTGFDADNLKLDQKSSTWRSIGTSATITSTFTSATVDGVALAFTNLTGSATITVELYLAAALRLTTGALPMGFAYDPPVGFATNSSPSFGFGGGNYFSTFFPETTADEIRVIINDATNPNGLIEVSRLIAGNSFVPAKNAEYGATIVNDDNTKTKPLESGDQIVNRGIINKVLSFSFALMVPADAAEINKIARRNGNHSPVFINLMPGIGGELEQAYQVYGLITNSLGNTAVVFNRYSSKMQVKEV